MSQKRDFEPMTISLAHKNARHLTPHLRSLGLLPPDKNPEKRPRITDPITYALERVLGVTPAPAKDDASADADPLALAKAADPEAFAEMEANPDLKKSYLKTFETAAAAAKEKSQRETNAAEIRAAIDARERVTKLAERLGAARGGQ